MSSILLVDDDPGVLDVVSFMLRREGFEVDEEREGTEALEAARNKPYDIVILDVMLPGMSGTDVCRALIDPKPLPAAHHRQRPAAVAPGGLPAVRSASKTGQYVRWPDARLRQG